MLCWLIFAFRLAAAILKSGRHLLLENLALGHQLLVLTSYGLHEQELSVVCGENRLWGIERDGWREVVGVVGGNAVAGAEAVVSR